MDSPGFLTGFLTFQNPFRIESESLLKGEIKTRNIWQTAVQSFIQSLKKGKFGDLLQGDPGEKQNILLYHYFILFHLPAGAEIWPFGRL
jgi:hypothetical protein